MVSTAVIPITATVFILIGVIGLPILTVGIYYYNCPSVAERGILDDIVNITRLENGTNQFERWKKFAATLSVYVFNVTNPGDVVDYGAKPKLKEMGPFVYQLSYYKSGIEYSESDDTLKYRQNYDINFDPAKSAYPESTVVTIINFPLQNIFLRTENGQMTATINTGARYAFGADTIFMRISVKQFFYEGYIFCDIDKIMDDFIYSITFPFCNSTELQTAVKDDPTMTAEDRKVRYRPFFTHLKNGTEGEYQITAGTKNIESLGEIQNRDDAEQLQIWNGGICNQIRGNDFTLFPPMNIEDVTFYGYYNDICRAVKLITKNNSLLHNGTTTFYAQVTPDNFRNDGDLSCFCIKKTKNLKGEYGCLPQGFIDMQNCMNQPFVASLPHFLWADKEYADTVEGLTPSEEKHDSHVILEPSTGNIAQYRKRVQYNTIVRGMPAFPITTNMRNFVLPLIWMEEAFDSQYTSNIVEVVEKIKQDYVLNLSTNETLWLITIGSGTILILISTAYFVFPRF